MQASIGAYSFAGPVRSSAEMSRNAKAQDKGRHVHPKETSSWQEEVKHYEYVYTKLFRIVPPYKFEFGTGIKERWIGRSLVEVFSQEFPYFDDSVSYYRDAVSKGRLRVNDEVATVDYRCRDGDVITHHVHRHEPPVSSDAVEIIQVTDDLVVVNKPSSLPIHPGGRYRRNCLVAVLAKEHALFDLHTVHRLDRLTSGVMLLGRSKRAADSIRLEFEKGTVSKKYLARVVGRFPAETVLVDQPLRCKNPREAIHEVHPEGKPSQTRITLLSTNGAESIVVCEPLTGRTHQIRLHLQWLGHPIGNDPLYGPCGVGSTAQAASEGTGSIQAPEGSEEVARGAEEKGAATAAATGESCGHGVAEHDGVLQSGGVAQVGAAAATGAGGGVRDDSGLAEVEGGGVEDAEGSGVAGSKRCGQEAAAAAAEGPADDAERRKRICSAGGGNERDVKRDEGGVGGRRENVIVCEELAREDVGLSLERNGWLDGDCVHCKQSLAEGCRGYYVPLKNKHDDSNVLYIWLHALSNEGNAWSFATALPPWATQLVPHVDLAPLIPGYSAPAGS